MKMTFSKQILRWIFTLLVGLLTVLASQVPADAMKIAFYSSRDFGDFRDFRYNIYVMNIDGQTRSAHKKFGIGHRSHVVSGRQANRLYIKPKWCL